MAEKKSIVEEALLDISRIQNALNANTTEILRGLSIEEIDGVVKESIAKKDYVEEEVEETLEKESVKEAETEEESETEKMTESDMSTEGMEEGTYEEGMEDEESEEIDMTQASDDDVIAVYKKLSGEDEIEIVGDEIHLNVTEPGEYILKTSDLEAEKVEPELGDDEDEIEYHIEMDDEEGETPEDLTPVDDEESEEEESEEEESEEEESEEEGEEKIEEKIAVGTGMSVGAHRNPHGPASIGAPENPKSKLDEVKAAKQIVSETAKKYNTLLTETKKLKAENEEFKTALKEFRKKLVETVVFNSNLTYVTKLFMEHSLTKAEKQNIIKRFDEEVTNLKESKRLYKSIVNEVENRKPINESIENKIIKEVTTGSSKQLNESTAYIDPSTRRIIELMNRVEKR